MAEFSIAPRGAFSLAQAAGLAFGPRAPADFDGTMRLAFCVDGYQAAAGVALTQVRDGSIRGVVEGSAPLEVVRAQVARILSLDHDGEAWHGLGEQDEVLGALQQRHHGLRPVLFHSPYEAAAWAIISARRGRAQAITTQAALCQALGTRVSVAGQEMWSFPAPERLIELDEMPGLGGARVERLHAVAGAASDGLLDAAHLQALGPDGADTEIQRLPGLGPFYSALVTMRAAGFADASPPEEPRTLAAAQAHYGEERVPDHAALVALAEQWRPFRLWALVLLRVAAEGATPER